ncbi:MAG: TerC family protein [Fimbriimonadaceae bacterium]|nr:TerC family protein [Fimbriimonadaceae bacterium]
MELAGIPLWIWGSFLGLVVLFLALDLGVFHRHAHEVKMKEALTWSAIWIAMGLGFSALVFNQWSAISPQSTYTNTEAGMAYITGYLVEKALSVDNLFVFLIVFSYFKVPAQYQHRVLFWGIIGALIFRGIFIAAGSVLLERFHWTMIVFGAFLIFTGIKMVTSKDQEMDPGKNPLVGLIRRMMPTTDEYHGQKFFTRIDGKMWATPLLLALLVVEFTDIIFAIDSVPAIFAITGEPFIVFTSNVFAILGLRSLYFALAGLMQMFHYLHYGLSAILVFVGGKMLYGFIEKDVWSHLPKFPAWISLVTILAMLGAAVLASVIRPPAKESETLVGQVEKNSEV